MGQNVNIGGDRLGSGAKMNVELHNYYRSTHNLSKKFQSSLAPGLLYPAYVNVGLNGDKFDIDIETITRTLPTQGPLFGAFKMQIDAFVAPIRLYHGVLHNNPINIGLKMKEVILPKFDVQTEVYVLDNMQKQVHESNLWKYLGLSGLGLPYEGELPQEKYNREYSIIHRKLNGVPLLAYYDIFKNYYANKQEEEAFVVVSENENIEITKVYTSVDEDGPYTEVQEDNGNWIATTQDASNSYITILGENLDPKYIAAKIYSEGDDENYWRSLQKLNEGIPYSWDGAEYQITRASKGLIQIKVRNQTDHSTTLFLSNVMNIPKAKDGITLKKFPLENIDKMREDLLSIKIGEEFVINERAEGYDNTLPYNLNSNSENVIGLNKPQVGLVPKTYQSDLFNNWIKSETIDGENGIGAITRIDTSNGLELDTLNLAQKVYNMLNRIAVSGGTYEDWQSAVYSYETIRKAETPMYVGGYSCEIMFDEVISTASTETQEFKQQSLGSIGGRGRQVKEKGGHIKFEIEEPSIIMILVSLTPRITYSQGNKWFLTEIDSVDDLHKPALDGIGYQDLLVEQMAFTGTTINPDGTTREKLSAGKTVAWINYMTDINECYGDFAAEEGKAYMVLNRNYDIFKNEFGDLQAPTDITTYIDPAKFNYAFTYNELQAQNFWTEIQFNVTARRLMSAKQIPNL